MKKKKKDKLPLRISILFTFIVSIILVADFIVSGAVILILKYFGFFDEPTMSSKMVMIYVLLVCVTLGIIAAKIVGEKIFIPISRLNEDMKKVAGGDFSVRMDESGTYREVREMTHNFNIMTEELDHTTIVHNDFTRNVSHEMKTPLATIEGYATLLQNPEITDEKRQLYASKIIESTRRLSALTGNILELSKLENKKIGIEKKMFHLDEQLRQVVLLFEDEWTKKDLEIDMFEGSVKCCGSEKLLFQVWQNLFGNAVKFTPEGGTIKISAAKDGENIAISITNTGSGISDEDQKRIFEKFYQADSSHNGIGNGLGLSIAKQITELHGGTISVSSELGKETTFTVSIPRNG